MKIYIVRHAWAGEAGDPAFPDDRLRPLTKEGAKRFRKFVKRLVAGGFDPVAVATSPLLRCVQTAELVMAVAPHAGAFEQVDALAPDSQLAPLMAWSQDRGGDVAWVGHMPDVSELTAALIGAGHGRISFNKGAAACVEFAGPVEPGRGELCWLATAKLLDC